jgi:Tfp pilus assembly protein PilX
MPGLALSGSMNTREEELMSPNAGVPEKEAGFALILAILALMLMTFLGLTLAATTSTELQIATNYRWSQQALYNAEAGLEYGKSVLRNMNWSLILPTPRMGGREAGCTTTSTASAGFKCWWLNTTTPAETAPTEPPPYARADPQGVPSRNFENSSCDVYGGGMGYGVVLDDGGGFGPYQNISNIPGVPPLNGTFTLWVRRDQIANLDGSFSDAPEAGDLSLVLTAEGTAPFTAESSALAFAQQNRAVKTLQATLSRTLGGTPCGTRGGQVGGGPEGSNFSPCDPITGDSLTGALGGTGRAELTGVQ